MLFPLMHIRVVAEVEVDTETGFVDVVGDVSP